MPDIYFDTEEEALAYAQKAPAKAKAKAPASIPHGRKVIQEIFPGHPVNSDYRGPNHPLSRKNPRSSHAVSDRAVDIPAIEGMTFEDTANAINAAGYDIVELRDEYKDPSPWATGKHWHFVIGDKKEPTFDTEEEALAYGRSLGGQTQEKAKAPVAPREINQEVAPKPFVNEVDPRSIDPTQEYAVSDEQAGAINDIQQRLFKIREGASAQETVSGIKRDYATVFPNMTDQALDYAAKYYLGGGKAPIDFFSDKTNAEANAAQFPEGTGASIAAPPPLTPWEVAKQSAEDISGLAGEGLNAALTRGVMKGLTTDDAYAREQADVLDERGRQARFWQDQAARTENPILDEVAKMGGELVGDFNPTYLIDPGSTIKRRMAAQAILGGGTDAVVQALETSQGLREGIDPTQVGTNALASGAFQGVVEGLGKVASAYVSKGVPVEDFADINPRVIETGGPVKKEARTPLSKKEPVKKTIGREVAEVTKGWENSPEIVVHTNRKSLAQAEPEIWAGMQRDKAQSAPGLMAADGKIHIVAENLKKSDVSVSQLIFHEALGHSGLRNLYREELDNILTKLYEGNWKIRKAADEYGAANPKAYAADADPTARHVEEVLAMASEDGIITKGVIDRVRGLIRKYATKMGLDKHMKITDRDVRNILADAHATVTGKGDKVSPEGNRYVLGVTDIAEARHKKAQKDNFFKTDYEKSPSLNELEDMIKEEEVRLAAEPLDKDVKERLRLLRGAYDNDNTKYMMSRPRRGEKRAGSINLDKAVSESDFDRMFHEIAKGIDGDKVSWDETIDDAAALGFTVGKAAKSRIKVDPAYGVAMLQMLVKNAEDLTKLSKKIVTHTATDRDKDRFAFKLSQQSVMQSKLAGWRSDVARALNAMKISVDSSGGIPKSVLEAAGAGKLSDANLIYKLAEVLDSQAGNPKALAKVVDDTFRPLPEDYFLSFRYNMMLFGLGTHFKNFLGNFGNMYMDLLETGIAATIGQGRKALGQTDRKSFRSTAAKQLGILKALTAAATYKDAKTAFIEGKPPHQVSKVEAGHNVFSDKFGVVGGAVELPMKTLALTDSFFRSLIENGSMYDLAVNQAMREGMKGGKLWDRVDELVHNPTKEMSEAADQQAAILQLVDDPTWFGKRLEGAKTRPQRDQYAARAGRTALHLAFPFARVADRLFMTAVRRIPIVGFLDRVNQADWKAGGGRRDMVVARMTVGAAIIGYIATKAMEGEISGEGPGSYDRVAQMRAEGWQPNSILIEGKWVPMAGFDQISPLASLVTSFTEKYRDGELTDDDALTEMFTLLGTGANAVVNNTFLEQAVALFGMAGNSPLAENNRENYIANFAGSFVPAGVRQASEISDGVARDTTGTGTAGDKLIGKLESFAPSTRKDLPVRHDVYGKPSEVHKNIFGVFQSTEATKDPVRLEIKRLTALNDNKALVTPVKRNQLNAVAGKNASAEVLQAYQKLSGEYIYESLKEHMATEEWSAMSDAEKIKLVSKITEAQRKYAREDLFETGEESE